MTIEDYENAKAEVIAALIDWLKIGEQLGKPQGLMAGEFMASFQVAAEEALNAS